MSDFIKTEPALARMMSCEVGSVFCINMGLTDTHAKDYGKDIREKEHMRAGEG